MHVAIAAIRNSDNDGYSYPCKTGSNCTIELFDTARVRTLRLQFDPTNCKEEYKKGTVKVAASLGEVSQSVFSGLWDSTMMIRFSEPVLCTSLNVFFAKDAARGGAPVVDGEDLPITLRHVAVIGENVSEMDDMKEMGVRMLRLYSMVVEPVLDVLEPRAERIASYLQSWIGTALDKKMAEADEYADLLKRIRRGEKRSIRDEEEEAKGAEDMV